MDTRRGRIGFTATHGLENAEKGPYFFWNNGKCNNALTINSWWHQNFILEYETIGSSSGSEKRD